jgi:hypothetical protein
MLGSKIVAAVVYKGTVEVKAMVRSSNDSHEEKRQNIDEMKAKGAAIVEVLGQKNLIDAAKQQGVKRFIPSDYSVDYRQLSLGRQRPPGYAQGGV